MSKESDEHGAVRLNNAQFDALKGGINAVRGAVNKSAEAIAPVQDKESISAKLGAITELIRNLQLNVSFDLTPIVTALIGENPEDERSLSFNIGKWLGAIDTTNKEGFAAVVAALKNQQPGPPPAQQLRGRFTLILKNDQPDFGYDFDVSGVTDAEGEAITDEAVLAAIVKEVTSDNEGVVSATPPDAGGAGTIHVGTSGDATLSGKAWLNQADKDAGKDPAFLAAEPFTITTGDPRNITEGQFAFDVESGGTPPA